MTRWENRCPDPVQAVLTKLVSPGRDWDSESEELPHLVIADVLDVVPPNQDHQWWVQDEIGRLSLNQACQVAARLATDSRDVKAVNAAFARADLELELIDGEVLDRGSIAVALKVDDAFARARASITSGRYAHAGKQWNDGLGAERRGDVHNALALYVNALEAVARTATGKNSLNDAVNTLFPGGVYAPLRSAINQLHNFASAFPGSRHGSTTAMHLDPEVLRGVRTAAAGWIEMIVNSNP